MDDAVDENICPSIHNDMFKSYRDPEMSEGISNEQLEPEGEQGEDDFL